MVTGKEKLTKPETKLYVCVFVCLSVLEAAKEGNIGPSG